LGFSLKRTWQAYAFEHPQFWQRIDAPGIKSCVTLPKVYTSVFTACNTVKITIILITVTFW